MANRRRVKQWQIFIVLVSKISAAGDCTHEIKRHLLLGANLTLANLDSVLKSRVINLLANVHIVKAMVFPVIMYGCESLDHKEGWELKNWCFQTVVLEKTFESPLDSKEIKPVNPKGNQPWIFIGRTDDEAETPIFWPPDMKSGLIGKYLDAGKVWRQWEKGTTEDKMVGWHQRFKGHEFEQTLADSERQGNLPCHSLCSCKESDITEQLNTNNKTFFWKQRTFLKKFFLTDH